VLAAWKIDSGSLDFSAGTGLSRGHRGLAGVPHAAARATTPARRRWRSARRMRHETRARPTDDAAGDRGFQLCRRTHTLPAGPPPLESAASGQRARTRDDAPVIGQGIDRGVERAATLGVASAARASRSPFVALHGDVGRHLARTTHVELLEGPRKGTAEVSCQRYGAKPGEQLEKHDAQRVQSEGRAMVARI